MATDPNHNEDNHPGITKIKQMWERGELEKIDEMVKWWEKFGETNTRAMKWYEAVENLGKLGEVLKRFIIWTGIIAGGYLALTGHITEWIRNIR